MLKKSLFLIIFLISINIASAISIQYCKSGSRNWVCYEEDVCECKILDDCTQGNIIVYKSNINNPLCMPKLSVDGIGFINLEKCGHPQAGERIKAVVDCNEGQTEEYELMVEASPVITEETTTSSSTTTTTVERPVVTIEEETTTSTRRATTTTIQKSSNKNMFIGLMLVLFALFVIGAVIFLKNQKKF